MGDPVIYITWSSESPRTVLSIINLPLKAGLLLYYMHEITLPMTGDALCLTITCWYWSNSRMRTGPCSLKKSYHEASPLLILRLHILEYAPMLSGNLYLFKDLYLDIVFSSNVLICGII